MENRREDKHPAYGVIEINRVQSTGKRLVGSQVKHNQYMVLRVSRARRITDDYDGESFMTGERIVEVCLSPAQIYSMLCNFNAGGTPCTIQQVIGEKRIKDHPHDKEVDRMKLAIDGKDKELADKVVELAEEAKSIIGSKKLLVKDKERLKAALNTIVTELKSNREFLHECNRERLEKMVAVAKLEAEAGIAATAQEIGLKAMSGELKLL